LDMPPPARPDVCQLVGQREYLCPLEVVRVDEYERRHTIRYRESAEFVPAQRPVVVAGDHPAAHHRYSGPSALRMRPRRNPSQPAARRRAPSTSSVVRMSPATSVSGSVVSKRPTNGMLSAPSDALYSQSLLLAQCVVEQVEEVGTGPRPGRPAARKSASGTFSTGGSRRYRYPNWT